MAKPDKIVDALLVIEYKGGNKKAFDLLVKRWNVRLCAHAYGYVKDWALAKDITQETWGSILRKIDVLRDANSFGSWAMTIASRKSLDAIAKQQKRQKDVDDGFWERQPGQQTNIDDQAQKIEGIKAAMEVLPLDQKIVLRLFYLEEYSLNEISKITNTSVNTVKTRLFRARERIRNELKIGNHEK